jgi:recombination protein RecT
MSTPALFDKSKAVEKRAPATIRDHLESDRFKSAVAAALPSHLKPERFLRVGLTAMTRNPKLEQCDQASFFAAMLTLSQLGLEPDGRLAHLIPFENRKRGVVECQLIIDYKGLVDLAMRSGTIAKLHADVVCEHDEFDFDRGEILKHKFKLGEDRGAVLGAYSLCRFKDGTEKAEVMSSKEVEAIRNRSRAGNSGPWVTDWNEMAKKTVFRRLSKWLPLSPEYRDALDHDADAIEVASTVASKVVAPKFELPEAAEEPDPVNQEPEVAEAPPEVEAKGMNYVAATRKLLKSSGVSEGQLLQYLREQGMDEAIDDLGLVPSVMMKATFDNFAPIAADIKGGAK